MVQVFVKTNFGFSKIKKPGGPNKAILAELDNTIMSTGHEVSYVVDQDQVDQYMKRRFPNRKRKINKTIYDSNREENNKSHEELKNLMDYLVDSIVELKIASSVDEARNALIYSLHTIKENVFDECEKFMKKEITPHQIPKI